MTDAPVRPDLDVRRLSGSLGAEIRGISLADATSADADAIHQLLLEHMVLFFPDQHLDPDEHIAFGRHFGTLESHPNLDYASERPEFFELRAEDGTGAVADEWHSDISFAPNPSRFAILQVKECPEVGGDTLWANAAKAYEELSPPLRELCDGLTALHDAGPHLRPEQTHIHPVVRVHPETGRRSLFVNEHFTRRIVELERRGVGDAAPLPLPLDPRAPLHGPVPVVGGHRGDVGQPHDPAPRAQRLPWGARDPAGHGHGRRTRGGGAVALAGVRVQDGDVLARHGHAPAAETPTHLTTSGRGGPPAPLGTVASSRA